MMTANEALYLKISYDLSDDQYQMIRNSSQNQNANIYPTLHMYVPFWRLSRLAIQKKAVSDDYHCDFFYDSKFI